MPATILIVEDHPVFAAAMRMVARAADPDANILDAASIGNAEMVARMEQPDLVLLDLVLPDVQGMAGVLIVYNASPQSAIGIVSARDDPATVRKAIELGARGFISKSTPMPQMIEAVRSLLAGRTIFPPPADDPDEEAHGIVIERLKTLSVAELRVLKAIAGGRLNKQVAYDLDIAESTVKSHLKAIFVKLRVNNRTQAVLALRSIDIDDGLS